MNINLLKRKWIRDTMLSTILVILLIALFILVNVFVNKLNIAPLDFTKEKLYTLSDESKEQIKNIDQEVHIYFFGYDENNSSVILAKQYHDINDKIYAEAIDVTKRPDLEKKYNITSSGGIIVESPERFKVLTASDFVTYDTTTYETIDVTEQKLTNAIIDTTISKKPHIYFLEGHEEVSITDSLATMNALLQNEINEVNTLSLLQQDIPEDCDVLAIASPVQDFADIEADKIIGFIKNGGNILWLENPSIVDVERPNINKVIAEFGFSFSKGMVAEEDLNRILLQNPFLIRPDISYHEITKDIYNASGVALAGAGRLNFQEDEKLNELGVEVSSLLTSSDKSTYIEDYSAASVKESNGEVGKYILGAEIKKKINEEVSSKLIVFSNCNFATDITASDTTDTRLVSIYNNKDLVLNSVAYLTNREDSIRIRKDSGVVTYTATQKQDNIVKLIIFIVPIAIIVLGIIVWQIRRRKK